MQCFQKSQSRVSVAFAEVMGRLRHEFSSNIPIFFHLRQSSLLDPFKILLFPRANLLIEVSSTTLVWNCLRMNAQAQDFFLFNFVM
jgi:hypothetical protein